MIAALRLPSGPAEFRAGGCTIPLFLALVLCAGCAKISDPLPPLVRVQRAAVDLSAAQLGGTVVLRFSLPAENTDGSPAELPARIELFRLSRPRGEPGADLTEEEFLQAADEVIAIAADSLPAFREGDAVQFQDELSSGTAPPPLDRSFVYAVRFVNRKNQTAGLSERVPITPVPVPPPPANVSFDLGPDRIRLSWIPPARNSDGTTPPRIAGYRVYRSENPQMADKSLLQQDPLDNPEFEDRSFQFDRTYYYAVSVVASKDHPFAESRLSSVVTVVARDTFPPGAPGRLDGTSEEGAIVLFWVAPPEDDVAGYRVYRRGESEAERRLLHSDLVRIPSFRDVTVAPGHLYEYWVAAVDGHGNEGAALHIRLQAASGHPVGAVFGGLGFPRRIQQGGRIMGTGQ